MCCHTEIVRVDPGFCIAGHIILTLTQPVVCGLLEGRSDPRPPDHKVRTGYGILEKLWNFEKEIPYMEKLWNLSKMAVPMEKLWNFRFGGKKKCVLSLRPDFEM